MDGIRGWVLLITEIMNEYISSLIKHGVQEVGGSNPLASSNRNHAIILGSARELEAPQCSLTSQFSSPSLTICSNRAFLFNSLNHT